MLNVSFFIMNISLFQALLGIKKYTKKTEKLKKNELVVFENPHNGGGGHSAEFFSCSVLCLISKNANELVFFQYFFFKIFDTSMLIYVLIKNTGVIFNNFH